jgi:hypothetical protein
LVIPDHAWSHLPRCGGACTYQLKAMKWKWECPDCSPKGCRFSNIAGTIFENTNIDLRQWFRVIHLMLTSKKGISSRQVYRYMGFGSLKTAWYVPPDSRRVAGQGISKAHRHCRS